jgi:uncharacterized cupredoxin-like copper-binding protein
MADSRGETNAVAIVAVFCSTVALIISAVALGIVVHHDATGQSRAGPPTTAVPAPATVAVHEQEYVISPAPATVAAGRVQFQISNDGNATHELIVVRTDLADGNLPRNADGLVDTTGLTIVGLAQDIVAGRSASVAADLTPGHYVLMCNISGHYANGMHTAFSVT